MNQFYHPAERKTRAGFSSQMLERFFGEAATSFCAGRSSCDQLLAALDETFGIEPGLTHIAIREIGGVVDFRLVPSGFVHGLAHAAAVGKFEANYGRFGADPSSSLKWTLLPRTRESS